MATLGERNLKKTEILFREGDNSDAMFVIKSGKLAITKSKGGGEITLAELGPGDMLGEMAFFDNKPRSATARAVADTTVIELPFSSLNAQFKTFPEWLKAIMRTVNNHLRNANLKIKNLEKTQEEEISVFPPHTSTRLMAILALCTTQYGEKKEAGIELNGFILRNYTIQIFQQPTHKMQKLTDILQTLGHMKSEDLGEGRIKHTIFHHDFILRFVEFYNEFLFEEESKRVPIEEREMKPILALLHYGKLATPNDKGFVKVNLTQMQNDSMKDLNFLFSIGDVDSLVEKKLVTEKLSENGGIVTSSFNFQDLQKLYPIWELIHTLRKVTST